MWLMVPETKDRSLEELDDMFQARISTRAFKNYVCTGLGAAITGLVEGKADAEWVEEKLATRSSR